jgi:hypothetical protein
VLISFLCVCMVPLHLLVLCGLYLLSLLMAFLWLVGWLAGLFWFGLVWSGLVWSVLVGRSVAILRKTFCFASSVSPPRCVSAWISEICVEMS